MKGNGGQFICPGCSRSVCGMYTVHQSFFCCSYDLSKKQIKFKYGTAAE